MEGKDLTIKIKTIQADKAWRKPNSKQVWWTITTEENPGEPSKYIQDEDKGIEKPETGKEYKGKMWGNKFYPNNPNGFQHSNRQGGGSNAARMKQDADKQADIKAEWAIAKAISSLQIFPLDDDALVEVEKLSIKLYLMVDRVKGTTAEVFAMPTDADSDTASLMRSMEALGH